FCYNLKLTYEIVMKDRNNMTDEQLIQVYASGDENGLSVLMDRYKSKRNTSIYIRVKNDYVAENICDESFMKIVKTIKSGEYREEDKFMPWVIRIAYNMVIDHFRKEKRGPTVINNDGYDIFEVMDFADDDTERKMVRTQMDVDLKKLIQLLPDDQKEVLIM